MLPPIISVVGKKKSGKTTLIEKLLPALKSRGLKVATIKRDAHKFDMDKPGKDTYRHFEAGADAVVISSSEKMAMIRRTDEELSLDEVVSKYLGEDFDLVITEGYKRDAKPKIEVHRAEISHEVLCGPSDNMFAMVTDDDIKVNCRKFGHTEIEALADFIVLTFGIR